MKSVNEVEQMLVHVIERAATIVAVQAGDHGRELTVTSLHKMAHEDQ